MASSLRTKSASGLRWLGAAEVLQALTQWGVQVILARLLLVDDFGVHGMALLVFAAVRVFADLGVGPALIQARELSADRLRAARRTSTWVSAVLYAGAFAAGPALAAVFDEPRLVWLVPGLCAGLLAAPLAVVPRALLLRAMRFRDVGGAETAGILAGGIASVAAALLGAGVWSLVIGSALTPWVAAAVLHARRPMPTFDTSGEDGEGARAVRRFGLQVMATAALVYVQAHVDYFAIGQHLGSRQLGLYTLAFSLMTLPHRRLAFLLSRVALPAFADVQADAERVRRGFLLVTRQIALAALPVSFGMALVAPEFIRVIYGEKWIDGIVPLQVLCLSGWIRAVGNPTGALLDGTGRPDLNLKLNLARAAFVVVGVFGAVPWGITAVAAVVTVVHWLLFPVTIHVVLRRAGLPWRTYLGALAPGVAGCTLMSGSLLALRGLGWLETVSDATRLLILVLVGAAIYLGYLWLVHRETLLEGLRIVTERRRSAGTPRR